MKGNKSKFKQPLFVCGLLAVVILLLLSAYMYLNDEYSTGLSQTRFGFQSKKTINYVVPLSSAVFILFVLVVIYIPDRFTQKLSFLLNSFKIILFVVLLIVGLYWIYGAFLQIFK